MQHPNTRKILQVSRNGKGLERDGEGEGEGKLREKIKSLEYNIP
jgi:hypothetical protein